MTHAPQLPYADIEKEKDHYRAHMLKEEGVIEMSTNIEVIQRLFNEVVNDKKLETVDELFSPSFIDHAPGPTQPPGPQGIKKVLEDYFAAFPDLVVTLEEIMSSGDTVATRETWRATHRGQYGGIAPTEKPITRLVMHFFHIKDGQIIEEWSCGESIVEKLRS